MICSKGEFSLLLSNWMTASQSIVIAVLLGNQQTSTSVVRLRGYIQAVEPDFFVVGKELNVSPSESMADDFVKVALDGWQYVYADPREIPRMNETSLFGLNSPSLVKEAVSLIRPNEALVSVFVVT